MQTINLTLNVTPEMFELLKPVLVLAAEVQKEKEPNFITLKEAVSRCPYGYSTLYKWIVTEGQIPSRQVSGKKGKHIVSTTIFDHWISKKLSGPSAPRTQSVPRKPKKNTPRIVGRPRKEPKAFA